MISYINRENRKFIVEAVPSPLSFMISDELFGIRLLHAGMVEFDPHRKYEPAPHRHSVYHIVLYVENNDFFMLNDSTYLASPGTLIITSPLDSHCFEPLHRNHYVYTEITFSVESANKKLEIPMESLLEAIFKTKVFQRRRPMQLGKKSIRHLRSNIELMVRLSAEDKSRAQASTALTFLNILLWLAENYFSHNVRESDLLPVLSPLEIARKEIETQINKPLNISSLSRLAGLSPNYFNTAFRIRFGMPPIRLQIQLRIEKASALLKNTDLRIAEIAERLGFTDIYHFSKTFKKQVGVSPLKYRQNVVNVAKTNSISNS